MKEEWEFRLEKKRNKINGKEKNCYKILYVNSMKIKLRHKEIILMSG